MNDKYEIITDSACDLTDEVIAANNLRVIPFYLTLDGEHYLKDNIEIKRQEFFEWCKNHPGKYPKTTLPTIDDYSSVFESVIESGKDIICICINSGFSGSFNSATVAKGMVLEKYKDARIEIIDSQLNCHAQGGIVTEALALQKAGKSMDEVLEAIADMVDNGRIIFTTYELDYLAHGGRIGKLAGLIGQVLKIKPLIIFKHGEITSGGVAITKQKIALKIIEAVKHDLKDKNFEDFRVIVCYALDLEYAKIFRTEVAKGLGLNEEDMPIMQNGAMIGVHTGPLAFGIALVKKQIK